MKLTSEQAYKLLIKDVIKEESDLQLNQNRWIKHCINVGYAATMIADQMGLDADYAGALGLIHDIGRKIEHKRHPLMGYKYMIEHGYPEEAGICLTHSFINNDIHLTAGAGPTGETLEFLTDYFSKHNLTIYDKIIQLCDLFCLDIGLTTIQNRLYDIYTRKGITEYSKLHIDATLELKREIEGMIGITLYELFPEINTSNLDNDNVKLKSLINK